MKIIKLFLCILVISLYSLSAWAAETDITASMQFNRGRPYYNYANLQTYTDISITNTSAETYQSPMKLVIDSISNPGVTVANSDGTTPDGKPYLDFSPLLGDGRLDPGETSATTRLKFDNPDRLRFRFTVKVIGEVPSTNSPPVIYYTGNLTINEGETLNGQVTATDPDSGDTITLSSTPLPNGSIFNINTGDFSWTPTYEQAGTYPITFTASDGELTDSVEVTITVNDVDKDPPVPDIATLPDITGECSATITTAPTATDAVAGLITGITTDPLTYTEQGTYIVTWSYDDGNGNSSTQTQQVIVKDVTAPVPDAAPLPVIEVEGGVSVSTRPTATDNCAETIIGTTTDPLTYSAPGEYIIDWSYDDGNGNVSTQQQTVRVSDNTPPVPDIVVLPVITGECSASVTLPPTANDVVAGLVTGTTSDPLIYTAQGTYYITWTYDDGSGNVSNQTQAVIVDDTITPVPDVASLPVIDRLMIIEGSTAGIFTNPAGPSGMVISGVGTNSFGWGTPPQGGVSSSLSYSGIPFNSTTDTVFSIGTLSYYNGVSRRGSGADQIDLAINVIFTTSSGINKTISLNLSLINTLNTTDPNASADIILFPTSFSNSLFTIDGVDYEFIPKGFGNITGAGFTTTDRFHVLENQSASLELLAAIRAITHPTATDNCTGVITATTTDSLEYSTPGEYTITWTYNDEHDNISTQEQIIRVNDNNAPVPDVGMLPTIRGECSLTISIFPTATDPEVGLITGTTTDPLTYSTQGTYIVRWTYSDGNGNSSIQTQLVIVDDISPPVPNLALLPVIESGENVTITTAPTATDNCAEIIIGTTTDPLEYTTPGEYTITWTYDDGNGNVSTQEQVVRVTDTDSPVPDIANLPDITSECSATVTTAPTATDAVAGSITGTTTDPLTYSTPGTHTITWSYDDGNGNTSTQTQTVVIDDITGPVPNVASLPVIDRAGSVTVTNAPTATDNCTGAITGTTADPLTYSTPGEYIITWSYDDGNGNTSTQQQIVRVLDNTPPVPDVAILPVVMGECLTTITTPPTATDNVSGQIIGITTDPLAYTAQGVYTVTWLYDDGSGNTTTQSQNVIVDDVTAPVPDIDFLPVIDGTTSVTVTIAPTATDNCVGTIIGTTTDPLTYSTPGEYTITWTYDDSNGNVTTQQQIVRVWDANAPIPDVTVLPTITGECSVIVSNTPTATDVVVGQVIGTTTDPLTYTTQGIHTITWNYDNGIGSSSTQTQTVIVDDITAPMPDIIPLPTITEVATVTVSTIPTATDNCKGSIFATTTDSMEYSAIGDHTITWTYDDGNGNITTQQQIVRVIGSNNPYFTSSPLTTATEDESYTYDADATDPNGNTITYSLVNAPVGMIIDSTTGLIEWTPDNSDVGSNTVTIQATDTTGLFATQNFTVTVINTNDPPAIISMPVNTANGGQPYTYDVDATDPDIGDSLTYSLSEAPTGMSINSTTGLIEWKPNNSQSGDNTVTVRVDDAAGLFDTQIFDVAVQASKDTLPPIVDISADVLTLNPSEVSTITVLATDNIGVTSLTLTIDGVLYSLDVSGQTIFTGNTPGIYKAVATAADAAGNEGTGRLNLTVRDPSDTTPPTVSFSSLPPDAEIFSVTDIFGTVDDENLVSYELSFSRVKDADFVTIASGTEPIIDGVLAQIDPSQLVNGMYKLRLTVKDVNGLISYEEQVVRVEGQAKEGLFTINFTDIEIPVSGIPITLNRTYDSRVKTSGDFGYGWNMFLTNGSYENNRTPGDGWQIVRGGRFVNFLCYSVQETMSHMTQIRLSENEVYNFRLQLSNTSPTIGGCWANASFEFIDGYQNGAALTILGNTQVFYITDSNEVVDPITFETYEPTNVRLTTYDGRVFDFDISDGLYRLQDSNGNALIIANSRLTHTSGKEITMVRDGVGRITEVSDPLDNTILYEYDEAGDLVSVTDQEGNITKFVYNDNHYLLDIIDPLGNRAVRSEYDETGRLITTIDVDGNRIEYTHNIDTRQEVVKDRNGKVTVYEYDDRGNVLSETDPDGNTKSYTYDSSDYKTSETDPLGNTTTYVNDENGNILEQTDPLGNTTKNTYDDKGRLLTTTDPLGRTTTNVYNTESNLTKTTDPAGNITTYTYDTPGNMKSMTDALGNTTYYDYDSYGNLIQETNPDGNYKTYTYDSNGNQLTVTDEQGNTTTNEYDRNSNLISTTDPMGNTKTYEYNAAGKQTAVIDKNGNRTENTYTSRGNIEKTTFADGTSISYGYDNNGNRTTQTDQNGNTTKFEYDTENRIVKTIYPDGSFAAITYDIAGRQIADIDANGNTTTYEYNAAGRQTRVIDASGNATTFEYDAAGNRTAVTDANGNKTSYEYDSLNRLVKTIFPDSTFTKADYDALDRITSSTDQKGNPASFEYNWSGRLIKVIDALGNKTIFEYDVAGNKTSQTDANGHVTTFEYDPLNRLIKKTAPNDSFETYTYDANGNMQTKTDANGQVTTSSYNNMNRLTDITYDDASTISYTYTPTGMPDIVTDSRGTTDYDYDNRSRLIMVTHPDDKAISYTYDSNGNKLTTSVNDEVNSVRTTTNTYTALNQLRTVTDNSGGLTSYLYDAVGNKVGVSHPNNTYTEYRYDNLNRLTYLENRQTSGTILSSYAYTLDANGIRTRVVEEDGRIVDYTYDALNRLIQEDIDTGTSVTTYSFDAVGNRLTMLKDGAATTYTYDLNDRLIMEIVGGVTTIYTYDANGNTTQKNDSSGTTTYVYGSRDKLSAVMLPDGAVVVYDYDAQGNRVAKAIGGTTTNYLMDTNRRYAQVAAEYDGSGNLAVDYTFGDNLLKQNRSGVESYYGYDGLGSTRVLVDGNGNAIDSYDYDAYGLDVDSNGTAVNDYLYSGEYYDGDLGQYYLRARNYNPDIGRFSSVDPFEGVAKNPMTLHRYFYANNNPINFSDPTGKFTLINISVSMSISSNLRSIHTKELLNVFLSSVRVIFCQLEPAYILKSAGINMAFNGLPGGDQIIQLSNKMIQTSYKKIGNNIKDAYKNMFDEVVKVKTEIKELLLPIPLEIKETVEYYKKLQKTLDEIGEIYKNLNKLSSENHCTQWDGITYFAEKLIDKMPSF